MTPDPAARGRLKATLAEPADLPALTSLRFFAAFAVLLLHYRDLLGPLPAGLRHAFVGGQYGVTFFFVLSGFILTYRYHGWFAAGVDGAHYARFQRLRFARLYPLYLLGLLLDTPWHLIERAQAGQLAAVGTTYWASWLLNLVGLQAWVPAVPFAMFWNTPAWSVAAEFFFYATFPFVCAALARRLHGTAALATAFAATVAGGIALYAAVLYLMNYVLPTGGEARYIVQVYNPLLRYSEFLAGCIAGLAFVRRAAASPVAAARPAGARWVRDAVVLASLAAVAGRVAMPDYTGPSAGWWLLDVSAKYGAFVLPFAALIVAVASGPTLLSPLLEHRAMVRLGEASYALYIVHWAGVSVLQLGFLGRYGTPLVHALCLLATVAASLACHRWVELPWRRRLRGRARIVHPAADSPAR